MDGLRRISDAVERFRPIADANAPVPPKAIKISLIVFMRAWYTHVMFPVNRYDAKLFQEIYIFSVDYRHASCMLLAISRREPHMAKEYRTVDRHGKATLDLEVSVHPEGASFRNWKLVIGALPEQIAEIRRDCGNGIISRDEMAARELAWHRAMMKTRRARRSA